MKNQPIINIGMIGHVADGKSTITKCLTGVKTQKHSDEQKRNITIKLGYANAKIGKCNSCEDYYKSFSSDTKQLLCDLCNEEMTLVNHCSFVDSPGHHMLMQTMINGTSVMDYTILVESFENQTIPAPQTRDHLIITDRTNIPNAVVCMNKVDLVDLTTAKKAIENLKTFLKSTGGKQSPLIPVSASFNINMDVLTKIIANLKVPERDISAPLKMFVIRSFNVNHPGIDIKNLKGGVLGGSIVSGKIKVGQKVKIFPGFIKKKSEMSNNTLWTYTPLNCTVRSINSEKTSLTEAICGGLIGVQLDIDPALTTDDKMVGQIVVSEKLQNSDVYDAIEVKVDFIPEFKKDDVLKKKDIVVISVNSNNVNGEIMRIKNDIYRIELDKPLYLDHSDKMTVSKKVADNINIMGIGTFVKGIPAELY